MPMAWILTAHPQACRKCGKRTFYHNPISKKYFYMELTIRLYLAVGTDRRSI